VRKNVGATKRVQLRSRDQRRLVMFLYHRAS
jgi:hypothetical protein